MSSISQCRHEEDMCANKHPKYDGCIFNGSRDIQQTSTLGLTDPARVPVLQTEREFRRVKERSGPMFESIFYFRVIHEEIKDFPKIFEICTIF